MVQGLMAPHRLRRHSVDLGHPDKHLVVGHSIGLPYPHPPLNSFMTDYSIQRAFSDLSYFCQSKDEEPGRSWLPLVRAVFQLTLASPQDQLCPTWRLVTWRGYLQENLLHPLPVLMRFGFLRSFWLNVHFKMLSSWKLKSEKRWRLYTLQFGASIFNGSV